MEGIDLIRKHNYRVFTPEKNDMRFDYFSWIMGIIDEYQPWGFILDIRDDFPLALVREIKKRGIKTISIDDISDRRLLADLAFYPPIPQIKRMEWAGFKGKLFSGWEWVLIRPEFSVKKDKPRHLRPVILVTMGGSDPQRMTLTAIQALEMLDAEFDVKVITGPAFFHHDALLDLLKNARHHYQVLNNVVNMADIMRNADIAVASFGVTAYELASQGVVAVFLCLSDDHAESASSFVQEGMMISLGNFARISPEKIADSINDLVSNPTRCKEMSTISIQKVDGNGVKRTAEKILESFNSDTSIEKSG
ncbi:MAG: hypothetical protein LUQ66_06565 [Methanoregula sp.]|nr:hypothetical protein [Methanoregula sp.]